jgi:hypothetical protein
MSKTIYFNEDGVKREATDSEIAQLLIDQQEAKARDLAIANELAAKAEAKAALLDRLGITAEEAKLLLS